MRVLIIADMEGVAGIAHMDACRRDAPEYGPGVRLLVDEVNVLAEAAFAAGASSVSVIDWHGGGGNLLPDLLDARVPIVAEDLTAGYDVVVLSGFHPMHGDQRGFISHTMYRGIVVEVEGRQVGELWLLSRWAGSHDIPVVLVTGDQAAIDEAAHDLPGTSGAVVKTARSFAEADVVPVSEAYEQLALALQSALQRPDAWHAYRAEAPLHFRLKLDPEPELNPPLPDVQRDPEGWLTGRATDTHRLIELIDRIAAMRVATK